MYLYNISIIIEDSVHQSLLGWVKQQLLANGENDFKLLKMLHSPHEGQTYCLQIVLEDQQSIENAKVDVVEKLQKHIAENYKEKAFIFDSIMQYIPH